LKKRKKSINEIEKDLSKTKEDSNKEKSNFLSLIEKHKLDLEEKDKNILDVKNQQIELKKVEQITFQKKYWR